MCFHDVEHVLSTIGKFLVYLLGEGEGRGEIVEGRSRGREWGGYENVGNGNARTDSPKTQHIWHLGLPPGLPPCSPYTFLESFF